MSNILDQIILSKKQEVEELKAVYPLGRLKEKGAYWNNPCRSLREALLKPKATGIIAEFKRKSPSKGWFKGPDWKVMDVAVPYMENGASALSILTDKPFFGGDLNDLMEARTFSSIPLLRKDFIIDPWQIAEAKAFGADVILLIAACLSPVQVKALADYALQLGLEVLLELHSPEELGHICDATGIIGINNRDLKTFEVNIERSLQMAEKINGDKLLVAESGIRSPQEIIRFRQHGFSGFLMGEHFMKEPDPGKAFADFVSMLKKEGQ